MFNVVFLSWLITQSEQSIFEWVVFNAFFFLPAEISETQQCNFWRMCFEMCFLTGVWLCFSFLLVLSCLVLSVFSTIPDHQQFANQGLFILVRPFLSLLFATHMHTYDFSIRTPSFCPRHLPDWRAFICACVRVALLASGGTDSHDVSRWEDSGVVDCAGNHRYTQLS